MLVFRSVRVAVLTAASRVHGFVAGPGPGAPPPSSSRRVGQPGKDVVWVPTPQALVDKMLDMAKLTPQDYHMDLGSGDGRTVITAAKRGCALDGRGIQPRHGGPGEAQRRGRRRGRQGDHSFAADIFETDFSKAQVLTLFLLPSLNLRLRPTILNMTPGTRVVSNSFTMDSLAGRRDRERRRRLHQLVHGAPVDRAGQGRGHVAAGLEHADPDPGVPDARAARWARRRSPTPRCAATRSPSRPAAPTTPAR